MAANKFGRYVWLVDLIKCHPYITFKEISDKWENSGLGDGKPLPCELHCLYQVYGYN